MLSGPKSVQRLPNTQLFNATLEVWGGLRKPNSVELRAAIYTAVQCYWFRFVSNLPHKTDKQVKQEVYPEVISFH
jgi:hypothetical protein